MRVATVAAVATLGSGTAVLAPAIAVAATPTCHIDLRASSLQLPVGAPLTLTWVATGADRLIASWTNATPPFAGSMTTTRDGAGPYAYQITGISNGSHCGTAKVLVDFLSRQLGSSSPSSAGSSSSGGASAGGSSSPTGSGPTAHSQSAHATITSEGGTANPIRGNPASRTAPARIGSGNGPGAGGLSRSSGGTAGSRPGTTGHGVRYPAQSPTGSSDAPWYEQPPDLVGIAVGALLAAFLIAKRRAIRATLARRH